MAKSADPVQAARKAAIKREAKRNRERKEQAQEARTLRRDTSALERQIHRLESRQATLNEDDQEELKRLQAEVANVKRIKEDYIRKHPEQKNFVRGYEDNETNGSTHADSSIGGPSRTSASQPSTARAAAQGVSQQTSTRDPRWSIYYDPVFNPYGAPPPGMPYLEKAHAQLVAEGLLDAARPPPLPEETAEFLDSGTDVDSDDSSVDEDLKDIVMPVGPPPSTLPLSASNGNGDRKRQSDVEAGRGRHQPSYRGGRGRGPGRPHHPGGRDGPHHHRSEGARPMHSIAGLPPRPPAGTAMRPAPPMNVANASPSRASAPTSGPPKPPGPPPSIPDGVVISAEPQLRDFKKESTAFVPAALRKKQLEEKERMKRGLPGRINAAPISEEMSNSSAGSSTERPDLLKTLQAHLPSKDSGGAGDRKQGQSSDISKQEYEHFLGEVGDLL